MTQEDINKAVSVLKENEVRQKFEQFWKKVTTRDIPDYRILIWGSVIEENKNPDDIDIIFSYSCPNTRSDNTSSIKPEKAKSIESMIKTKTYTKEYDQIDPIVKHRSEIPSIISNSRISKPYCVDDDGYIEY